MLHKHAINKAPLFCSVTNSRLEDSRAVSLLPETVGRSLQQATFLFPRGAISHLLPRPRISSFPHFLISSPFFRNLVFVLLFPCATSYSCFCSFSSLSNQSIWQIPRNSIHTRCRTIALRSESSRPPMKPQKAALYCPAASGQIYLTLPKSASQ